MNLRILKLHFIVLAFLIFQHVQTIQSIFVRVNPTLFLSPAVCCHCVIKICSIFTPFLTVQYYAHSITCRFARSPKCNMDSSRSNNSSKDRMKWTKDLHDLFEKAVNQIGGPDRATPKGILRAMAIEGLTIYHVKSHLQKYRMSIFTREEDYIRGKLEKKSIAEMLPNFGATVGLQLSEALQIQMEAQRRLSDQLEVQRSLKMKMEAQARFLDKITEEYKNKAVISKPIVKPFSPILSLPSLNEESDQSDAKEFDTDSEDTSEIRSKGDYRPRKRIKIHDDIMTQMHKLPPINPIGSQNSNSFSLDCMNNNVFVEQEINFPWNIGAFQSPLPAIYNPLNY